MIEGLMGAGAGLSLLGMGMNMAGEYQGNRAVGRAIGANYERKNAIRQQRQALVGNRVAELQASNPGAMMSGLATKWTGDQAQAYNAGAQPFLEQGYGVSEFDPNSAWLKNFAAAQQAENGASAASNNRNANEFRELQIQSDVADQAAQRDMMVAGRKGQGLRTVGALAQGLGGLGFSAGMAFNGPQTGSLDLPVAIEDPATFSPGTVGSGLKITEQQLYSNDVPFSPHGGIGEAQIDDPYNSERLPTATIGQDGLFEGLSAPVEYPKNPELAYTKAGNPLSRKMQRTPYK